MGILEINLMVVVVALAVVLAITRVMVDRLNGIGSVLVGMDGIIGYINKRGFYATPFLIRKWILGNKLPIRLEADRYFSTTCAIDKWLHKNRKNIEKI